MENKIIAKVCLTIWLVIGVFNGIAQGSEMTNVPKKLIRVLENLENAEFSYVSDTNVSLGNSKLNFEGVYRQNNEYIQEKIIIKSEIYLNELFDFFKKNIPNWDLGDYAKLKTKFDIETISDGNMIYIKLGDFDAGFNVRDTLVEEGLNGLLEPFKLFCNRTYEFNIEEFNNYVNNISSKLDTMGVSQYKKYKFAEFLNGLDLEKKMGPKVIGIYRIILESGIFQISSTDDIVEVRLADEPSITNVWQTFKEFIALDIFSDEISEDMQRELDSINSSYVIDEFRKSSLDVFGTIKNYIDFVMIFNINGDELTSVTLDFDFKLGEILSLLMDNTSSTYYYRWKLKLSSNYNFSYIRPEIYLPTSSHISITSFMKGIIVIFTSHNLRHELPRYDSSGDCPVGLTCFRDTNVFKGGDTNVMKGHVDKIIELDPKAWYIPYINIIENLLEVSLNPNEKIKSERLNEVTESLANYYHFNIVPVKHPVIITREYGLNYLIEMFFYDKLTGQTANDYAMEMGIVSRRYLENPKNIFAMNGAELAKILSGIMKNYN